MKRNFVICWALFLAVFFSVNDKAYAASLWVSPDVVEYLNEQKAKTFNVKTGSSKNSPKNKKAEVEFGADTLSNLFEQSIKHVVRVRVNSTSSGSGFVWTKDGYILTNAHVVREVKEVNGVKEVRVYVSKYKYYKARVIGEPNAEEDIAVLKIDEPANLTPALLGDSDKVKQGHFVYAIGAPFGLDSSVTFGIVSGLNRRGPFGGVQEAIQTDAAINPGNSGGPLHNLKGEVIGMNTSILNPEKANNIGFAIPINDVLLVAKMIVNNGKTTYARLGVAIVDLASVESEEVAKARNIPWPLPAEEGVYVNDVQEGTGAEKAGIAKGDIIVSFNGVRIMETFQLQRLAARSPVGALLPLIILRNGKELRFEVVLTGRPPMNLDEKGGDNKPEKK